MKKRIMKGEIITLTNAEYQNAIKSDDVREAELSYRFYWGQPHYVMWFNGIIIHSLKTYGAFEKHLNKLITDWHLKEMTEGE